MIFSVPSKVTMIVIQVMLLGINIFWTLLIVHFNPRLTGRAELVWVGPKRIYSCEHKLYCCIKQHHRDVLQDFTIRVRNFKVPFTVKYTKTVHRSVAFHFSRKHLFHKSQPDRGTYKWSWKHRKRGNGYQGINFVSFISLFTRLFCFSSKGIQVEKKKINFTWCLKKLTWSC